MLGIVAGENHNFSIPNPSSLLWEQFDAVRFAGYTETHSKRSVKILSLEYFSGVRATLDILSFKDGRLYPTDGPGPTRLYRVQQATRLPTGFLILHDQLVYQTPLASCVHGREALFACFGVTANLIASGACLFGQVPYGREIKTKILSYYSAVTQKQPTTQLFARHTRFSVAFTDWLSKELFFLNRRSPLPHPRFSCGCPTTFRGACLLYGTTNASRELGSYDFSQAAKCVSHETSRTYSALSAPSLFFPLV